MAYDPRVVNAIKRIATERRVPRKWLLAALTTGIVESNLQNLPGGHADSAGWRQERASLYPDPTNIEASVNRFFNEASVQDRGQSVGRLAADVQRPAEQYRDRYAQVLGQAKKLAGGRDGGGETAAVPTLSGRPNLFSTLARLNAPQAAIDPAYAQLQRGWEMLSQIQGQQATSQPSPISTLPGRVPKGRGSGLFELFYDPVGGWKRGKSIGPIGGHQHIHAAAGPKTLRGIAEEAQRRGLSVRELEPYDPVERVHAPGSYHYKGRAADISGPEEAELDFVSWLRRRFGLR